MGQEVVPAKASCVLLCLDFVAMQGSACCIWLQMHSCLCHANTLFSALAHSMILATALCVCAGVIVLVL
jgi:hypothetical protein